MNLIDQLIESLQKGAKPNSLTREMGYQIRIAREEMGFSQRELSKLIYRRQAALSEIENGLMEPDAETLLLLSLTLKKPIAFFFPNIYRHFLEIGKLSDFEQELILQFRRLADEEQKIILAQIKAIADLHE